MKGLYTILFLLISSAALPQNGLDALLSTTSPGADAKERTEAQLQSFVQPLLNHEWPEQKLLRKTFHRLHTTFLKKYEAYSDFGAIFSSGQYDCLTATALFSQVLDQLNVSYEIIETNYHIFLIVRTSKGEVLLETTDRWSGFVTGEAAISRRKGNYRRNTMLADNSANSFYQYPFSLYQEISPEKLTGLLYFNQAVRAYNHHDWMTSATTLEKANALYASPRCRELGALLIQTVSKSSMKEKAKTECLAHLNNFQVKDSRIFASN
jgi:hypothetical protein